MARDASPGPGYQQASPDPRPRTGVGMLGYGFMGKAHSNALRTMTYIDWPGIVRPELVAIAGRTEERAADAAARYGFDGYYTDWPAWWKTNGSASLTMPPRMKPTWNPRLPP